MIICRVCERDIDAIGQDNMSYGGASICETCAAIEDYYSWLYEDDEEEYEEEEEDDEES